MFRTPGLVPIILTLALLATFLPQQPMEWHSSVWDARLAAAMRCRQRCNPQRNLERRLRRGARRQRPGRLSRHHRRRGGRRRGALWLSPASLKLVGHRPTGVPSPQAVSPAELQLLAAEPPPDPLADLRQQRGWIDRVSQRELWQVLIRLRWPNGECCPQCGEDDRQYLHVIDPDYRGGLGRWRCDVCAEAGDPGEGGTFTPLTGTLLEGMRLEIHTLWLVVEHFVEGQAAVETADEARLHRHTAQRLFRLLRAALYQNRSSQPIALAPEHIVEGDEVYLTAGVKGQAGGLELERAPRKRGLKRRGRGTWESDRLPVFGLLCREGQVRLFVLRNVQSQTIRPIVHQMVGRGARVYTDSYSIYHFLARDGYQHRTVNHGAGEYARDEVHCNTMECTWSWLRQMIRTYRGVSKVYLPLYVAQFEFFYNRRHDSRWSRMLDLMQIALQVDAAPLLARVDSAEFAEVCPVAG